MGRHTGTGRKKEDGEVGRREPPTPHSHKPTPGFWLALLGAEERSHAHKDRVYPTTKKENCGGRERQRKHLGLFLTICRRSRERERVGRGASWQPVVQKTALGKGFWALSPMGCTWEAESWDTRCSMAAGRAGRRFSLSPRLNALHRTR